jgi:acyl carrier protein
MMQDQIRDYLLAHAADSDVTEIADDESLLEAGVIDSAGMVGLIAFLEGTFGITIDEDDMIPENFDSLSAIAAYVTEKAGTLST